MGDGGSENLGRVYAARNPDEIVQYITRNMPASRN